MSSSDQTFASLIFQLGGSLFKTIGSTTNGFGVMFIAYGVIRGYINFIYLIPSLTKAITGTPEESKQNWDVIYSYKIKACKSGVQIFLGFVLVTAGLGARWSGSFIKTSSFLHKLVPEKS
jgi:hypothetical protein